MTVTIPELAHLAGVPSQWSDDITPAAEGLIVSETPAAVVVDMQFAANQTIQPNTAVGKNADGKLVPAVYHATPANAIKAIGVSLSAIPSTAAVVGAPVLIQATVNVSRVVFDASFDTEAKKLAAFEGAPTPTAIIPKKVVFGATVSNP